MLNLLPWLDAHAGIYRLVAGGATAVYAAWVVVECRRPEAVARPRCTELLAGLLLLGLLLAWRWPALLAPDYLNPDEAQLVAGAITLEHDPCFWRSLDGTTSGPLNFAALLPTHWLGVPQDYLNARLAGLLMVWGALWACRAWLRLDYDRATVALGLLPGVVFFSTATDSEFIHYSSEHCSLLLMSAAAWLLWLSHRRGWAAGTPGMTGLLAALLAGALPWAKLQSAPFAAALVAWGGWLILTSPLPRSARLRRLATFVLMALAPTGFVLLGAAVMGRWHDLVQATLLNNFAYVSDGISLAASVRKLAYNSHATLSFPALFCGSLLLAGGAGAGLALARRRPRPLFWVTGLAVAVAVLVVLAPRHGYRHYLIYLALPLTCWVTASLAEVRALPAGAAFRAGFYALAGLVVFGGQFGARLVQPPPFLFGRFTAAWQGRDDGPGRLVRGLMRPGDTLAVWGWNCDLYVVTGLPQATHEAHTERQIQPGAQRDGYYRPRYLADLERNRPAFFVDAVGPKAFGFDNRERDGHESVPALRDYIGSHYVLAGESGACRIYVRTDRAAGLPDEPGPGPRK